MTIGTHNYQVHLQDEVRLDREYCKAQENKTIKQKALCRDTVEFTGIKENKEAVLDQIQHTAMQSATLFSDTRAGILQEIRESFGEYGYSEVVNACGLSYAKLYAEIEERHESGEQFYMPNGTLLTKEGEIGLLDQAFDNEVAWQTACTKVAVQREVLLGNLPAIPEKEIEELENCFYKAKDAYLLQYEESKQTGKPLSLQDNSFGSAGIFALFNGLRTME